MTTEPRELAELIVAAGADAGPASVTPETSHSLAEALATIYDESRANDAARATAAARAIVAVGAGSGDPETAALAAWVSGKAALQLDGRTEEALALLDEAAAGLAAAERPLRAALVQINRIHALALLGRYEDAVAAGLAARDVFVAHGQQAPAGQIELNLGNIAFRRDRYADAEGHYRAAFAAFQAASDNANLARATNNLAIALTWLHRFPEAEALYEQALPLAEAVGLALTQAEVECNLGNLAMLRGRYDQALDYLERSRRRHIDLGMPYEAAAVELELADAYLELNLAPEAAAIYQRLVPLFAEAGMRFEEAWATAHHGRAAAMVGRERDARRMLVRARRLFAAEGNQTWVALVRLAEAQLSLRAGRYDRVTRAAARAEADLAGGGHTGQILLARWLRAEAALGRGRDVEASELLVATMREAEAHTLPQVVWRCCTALGRSAARAGDLDAAERWLARAVAVVEALRAPLPAEEFRVAFVADKLAPYSELARLCLDGPRPRVTDALIYVERGRSRALADLLGGAVQPAPRARDPFEREAIERLEELRTELSWLYSQLHRPADSTPRSSAAADELQAAIETREEAALTLTRQLQQRSFTPGDGPALTSAALDLPELQAQLGETTALVEYAELDGELLAFVVTGSAVSVVRDLGRGAEIEELVGQLRFQTDTLRGGAERVRRHLPLLEQRARHYLRRLYDLLLRPLEGMIGGRRLVVVPHRALHYVPFHALHDGAAYVIESREVSYAPSALVLRHCLAGSARPWRRALLLGVPDEAIPRVRDEVQSIAPLFPEADVLLDDEATGAALRAGLPGADLLHLACHGRFRPDSPLFSALRLADGWLTVRDAYGLDLDCGLIVLSACETGVSAVAPGDELLGLARGFLSAGAPAMLVSLWPVDDAATTEGMGVFYRRLIAGERPAAALRAAQRALLTAYPHPFFWSPFVLIGRW